MKLGTVQSSSNHHKINSFVTLDKWTKMDIAAMGVGTGGVVKPPKV